MNKDDPRTMLITGGCGMLGTQAALYFKEKGYDVDVMDNLERASLLGYKKASAKQVSYNENLLKKSDIAIWKLDVSRKESFGWFDGHDVVVHLAGQCSVPVSIENPSRDFEVNTIGTMNTLEYARKYNSSVVFASTNKTYPIHDQFVKNNDRWSFIDKSQKHYGFPETNSLVGARTPYGNSKYMADLLCQEWAYTYDMKIGVFRMSCIYAPQPLPCAEQGWLVWFVVASILSSPIIIYGDGHQVRDVLYATDCVRAYDMFIESNIKHGVYNLGGGPDNTISLIEHIDYIEKKTGKRSEVVYEDWRPLDQKCYVSDIRHIANDLNWTPSISPEVGTDKVIKWVNNNMDLFK